MLRYLLLKLALHDVKMNGKIYANNSRFSLLRKTLNSTQKISWHVERDCERRKRLYILINLLALFFWLFEQRDLHFYFALSPVDHVASPTFWLEHMICLREIVIKQLSSCLDSSCSKAGDCLELKSQHSLFSVFPGAQDWLITLQRWLLTQVDLIPRQTRLQEHFRNVGEAPPFTQGKIMVKRPDSGDWNPSSALKNHVVGLPWWRSGWESACQCRGHGFEPWSGKIPHAAEHLGPWATTTEPARLEPVPRSKRGRDSETPTHCDEEWPPLATTRESPHTKRRPDTAKNK